MALATQCPHCHTTFRVAHDQLKLRAGLVRCGACKQIFNGIENLLRPEELEPAAHALPPLHRPPVPETKPAATSESSTETPPETPSSDTDDSIANRPDFEPGADEHGAVEAEETPPTEPPVPEEEVRHDPLLRMTLMDYAHARSEAADDVEEGRPADGEQAPDALESVIDDLQSKPWRRPEEATEGDALDQADASDFEEPAFVRQGRRKQRIGRVLRIFMMSASVILLITLMAQSLYVFRDRIAVWFPQTKPVLAQACAYLNCQVGLPAQIDVVSIESSELQTLATNANTFALTVLLRNHGATEQGWPHIELTLNDANEKPIARRVFAPREYLPTPQDLKKGFGARSEQPVKLYFELSQLKASGYRVYLFYP